MAVEKDWREECKTMGDQEGYLLETGIFSDISFKVGKEEEDVETLRAHKIMLYRASSVFEIMFYGSLPETGEVRVTDIEPEIFKLMLKYIYTDVLPDNLSVQEFIYLCLAANKYLLYSLRKTCIQKLVNKVDVENVWILRNLASLVESPVLLEATLKLLCEKATELFVHPEFLDLSHDNLKTIVKTNYICVKSEIEVINACLLWAEHQCRKRPRLSTGKEDNVRSILGEEIISNLRFLSLTSEEFATGPGAENWLTSEEKLSIFTCLSAPPSNKKSGNPKLLAGLCSKVDKRNTPSLSAKQYDISLTRTQKGYSEFNTNMFTFCLTPNKDIILTSISIYSQTNNTAILNKTKQLHIKSPGKYYEKIELIIGKHFNHDGNTDSCFTSTAGCEYQTTSQFMSLYNNVHVHKLQRSVKLLKNKKYFVQLKLTKGHYKVCDLINDGSQFRCQKVYLTWEYCTKLNSSQVVMQCPIRSISFIDADD